MPTEILGFPVLGYIPFPHGEGGYALVDRGEQYVQRYSTSERSAVSGHYITKFEDALGDLIERASRRVPRPAPA